MSNHNTADATQTSLTAMTDDATQISQREQPEQDIPETPTQPDVNEGEEGRPDVESETEVGTVPDGFTRKRMSQEVGTGIDQRGEVTVELVKESRKDAAETMQEVFPLAVDFLRYFLDMAEEEPLAEELESIPATDEGWVRIRMWVKRGQGKDERADTQTESVRVDGRKVLAECVMEMRTDVPMLKASVGLTDEEGGENVDG